MEKFIDTVVQTIANVRDQLVARLETVETRLAALESGGADPLASVKSTTSKRRVVFRGAWDVPKEGDGYMANEGVTHNGALWVATINFLGSEPAEGRIGWERAS